MLAQRVNTPAPSGTAAETTARIVNAAQALVATLDESGRGKARQASRGWLFADGAGFTWVPA